MNHVLPSKVCAAQGVRTALSARTDDPALHSKIARVLKHADSAVRAPALGFVTALMAKFALSSAHAATNAAEEIGVPKLVPPYSELPPTFWERNGTTVILSGLAGLLVVGAIIWFLRRSKPVVVLPPEVRARRALEALRAKAEDGDLLSQVSRILREYFLAAFELPPDELTTTEFCRMLSRHEKIGAELAAKASDFLRRCDERKFSALPAEPLNAVAVALELVELAEARRRQVEPENVTNSR
jgi:hypothetical protein